MTTRAGEPPSDHLFVYGSLRAAGRRRGRSSAPSEPAIAADRIAALGRRVGEASMQGRLFAVSWYPGLVPSRRPHERVAGDLWRVIDRGALFPALDAYEGGEYVRVRRIARTHQGEKFRAWVYIYAADLADAPEIACGDYEAWLTTNGPKA